MRELTSHKTNPANDTLVITVQDEPGAGGAHHLYRIEGFTAANPSLPAWKRDGIDIVFQNGPIAEDGVNGLTHEALLAILIDRLECFQAGPFANSYNETAMHYLQAAQVALQNRTRERMSRGVEGTHQK